MKKLAALAAAVLLLSGCNSGDDEEVSAVCTDGNGVRVDDSRCGSGDSALPGFMWFYMLSSLNRPGIGTQVTNNNYYTQGNPYGRTPPPKTVSVQKAVPPSGKPANPAPKVNSPQDKPNPNIKPGAPVNKAPAPPPYKPPAPAPKAK